MTISTNTKNAVSFEKEMVESVHGRFTLGMATTAILKLGGELNKFADYLMFEFYDGSVLSVVENDDRSIALVDETQMIEEVRNA